MARQNWVVSFDNLSHLPGWLSDALCRLATGGGFGTRSLYTDDEEIVFDVKRPVILNGIGDVANRPDLLDRAISLVLPAVTPAHRRLERDLNREFTQARASILGGLLDAAVASVKGAGAVWLPNPPGLADFATNIVACEAALGWKPGSFMDAYRGNQAAASSIALEASPVAYAVIEFMGATQTWSGTASALLTELTRHVGDHTDVRQRGWPKAPNTLSNELRRAQPDLRSAGVIVEFTRDPHTRGRQRTIHISRATQPPPTTVRIVRDPAVQPGPAGPVKGASDDLTTAADDPGDPDNFPSSATAVHRVQGGVAEANTDDTDDTDGLKAKTAAESIALDYSLCRTIIDLETYLAPALATGAPVALDWEATSLNLYDGSLQPVGLAVSIGVGSARYVPVGHSDISQNVAITDVIALLQRLDSQNTTLWYNYRYDGEVCRIAFGGWEPARWEDVMIALQIADPDCDRAGLKANVARLLGATVHTYDEVVGGRNFKDLAPLEAWPYAAGDADYIMRLWQLPTVQTALAERRSIYQLEKDFLGPVRDGVRAGVFLDPQRLRDCKNEVDKRMAATREELHQLAGHSFDVQSDREVRGALERMGVPITERTKSGRLDTSKETLRRYADRYPMCHLLSLNRSLRAQDTWIAKLSKALTALGNPVRFSFRPMGARSGRMTAGAEGSGATAYSKGYVDVNVQSIPAVTGSDAVNIRSAVCADFPPEDDSYALVTIDYSQIELRVAAALSREPAWLTTFNDPDGDIHLTNAKIALRRPDLTKADCNERARGKTLSFAVLYGAGANRVASSGGITRGEAAALITDFFAGAPVLKRWIDQIREQALHDGFVTTAFGRVRPVRMRQAGSAAEREKRLRQGVNTVVQGTAADLFKMACVRVHHLIADRGWSADCTQILWVHDEVVLRVRRSRLPEILPEVVAALESTPPGWAVPLKANVRVGSNWGELSEYPAGLPG